jgi:hypothetical protein
MKPIVQHPGTLPTTRHRHLRLPTATLLRLTLPLCSSRERASPFRLHCIALHCIAMPAPCSRPYASSHHDCRPASDHYPVACMQRHCSGIAVLGTGVLPSVVPARPKLASSPSVDQEPGPDWEHVLYARVRTTPSYPVQTWMHRLAESIKATRAATSRRIRNIRGLPVKRLTGVAGTVCVQVRPPG